MVNINTSCMLFTLEFSFGAAGREHEKFIYNDEGFLLTLAIADNALFSLQSLDDVRNMDILYTTR